MLKKATGLGVMLVGKGGAAGERGGASACSSGSLQLGGVRGRGRYAGAAAAVGGGGRTGGTRGLLRQLVQIARQSPPDCRRHSFLNSGMRRCLVWAWGTGIIGCSRTLYQYIPNLYQHHTIGYAAAPLANLLTSAARETPTVVHCLGSHQILSAGRREF